MRYDGQTGRIHNGQVAGGGGRERTSDEGLPGSGGARVPRLCARKQPPEQMKNTKRWQEAEYHTGRERRVHKGYGSTNGRRTPQGEIDTYGQAKGGKGGSNGRETQRQKQACSVGRRYERRRLSGDRIG